MALELARRFNVDITAIDFAAEMIAAANTLAKGQTLKGRVEFQVGDVQRLQELDARYDAIYTERVLINLSDWNAQRQAIIDITQLLKPNGIYIMCENSQDGVDKINQFRACL